MRLLRALATASVLGAWAVIVLGGYVSHTESGLGCSELIPCGAPTNPQNTGAALIESAHRVAAWVEGLVVLALLVLVWRRFRSWVLVRDLTTFAFELVVLQATLGILAVATHLDPLVVTAHLGIAAGFLAVTVLNAATIFRGAPPPTATLSATSAGAPQTG